MGGLKKPPRELKTKKSFSLSPQKKRKQATAMFPDCKLHKVNFQVFLQLLFLTNKIVRLGMALQVFKGYCCNSYCISHEERRLGDLYWYCSYLLIFFSEKETGVGFIAT